MNADKPKKPISPETAKARLEALCARSEQCSYELRQKLNRWGLSTHDAEKIITHLIANRYVDDNRFTRAFVNDKIRFERWGQRKVWMALRQKGIPEETIRENLEELDEEQIYDNLKHLLSKKRKTIKDTDPRKIREKLLRFGLSRGYTYDQLARVLSSEFRVQS